MYSQELLASKSSSCLAAWPPKIESPAKISLKKAAAMQAAERRAERAVTKALKKAAGKSNDKNSLHTPESIADTRILQKVESAKIDVMSTHYIQPPSQVMRSGAMNFQNFKSVGVRC